MKFWTTTPRYQCLARAECPPSSTNVRTTDENSSSTVQNVGGRLEAHGSTANIGSGDGNAEQVSDLVASTCGCTQGVIGLHPVCPRCTASSTAPLACTSGRSNCSDMPLRSTVRHRQNCIEAPRLTLTRAQHDTHKHSARQKLKA